MYQFGIVEDDFQAQGLICEALKRYAKDHGLEFSLLCFKSALDLMSSKNHIDCYFLDIDLPGINGLEVAHLIRSYDESTPIVFVTNLAQYALKGYEVQAIDFIVKPLKYFDFRMRMDKVMRNLKRNSSERLLVHDVKTNRVVLLSSIVYVEVNGHYLSYTLSNGEKLKEHCSLKQFESRVGDSCFVRISHSSAINMNHIVYLRGDEIRLSNNESLYFSRGKKKQAQTLITSFLGGSI